MLKALDNSILRAYDVRGVYQQNLDENDAYSVGLSFAQIMKHSDSDKVIVGRDGRLSSPSLQQRLMDGLIDGGASVIDIGVGPSPMVYFAEYFLKGVDAAIMVTGSHNPANYNGFKISFKKAPFFGDDIQRLGDISRTTLTVGERGRYEKLVIGHHYIERLLRNAKFCGKKPRIVWDPGHGATAEIVNLVAARLPGQHLVINNEIDGNFPSHHPDPTVPKNLVDLDRHVKSFKADFGVAFDGDGDRIGVVSKSGRIVWGDEILMVLAKGLLKRNPGATIIADVKASNKLFDYVDSLGGKSLMWKTGHSHIKYKMKETGTLLAGEMSGHIFMAEEYHGFDDAIMAAIRFINAVIEEGKDLDSILNDFPKTCATPEIRIDCDAKLKFEIPDQLKKIIEAEGLKYNDIDGIRVTVNNGWWLVRASNTQDILVARCEAEDVRALDGVKQHLTESLAKVGFDLNNLSFD